MSIRKRIAALEDTLGEENKGVTFKSLRYAAPVFQLVYMLDVANPPAGLPGHTQKLLYWFKHVMNQAQQAGAFDRKQIDPEAPRLLNVLALAVIRDIIDLEFYRDGSFRFFDPADLLARCPDVDSPQVIDVPPVPELDPVLFENRTIEASIQDIDQALSQVIPLLSPEK